jgi:hypothetical protein
LSHTGDPPQKQELATIIHLCGAGPARVFARHGFSLAAGERCGDHDVAAYLAQINAMEREFQRFAADEPRGISMNWGFRAAAKTT